MSWFVYAIRVRADEVNGDEPTPERQSAERQSAVRDHVMRRFQEARGAIATNPNRSEPPAGRPLSVEGKAGRRLVFRWRYPPENHIHLFLRRIWVMTK
ncbi:MAG: hypothetical protein GX492_11115 [Firmicutes bacterium]|nr:hypothetical protein [Bacillota bacterium]